MGFLPSLKMTNWADVFFLLKKPRSRGFTIRAYTLKKQKRHQNDVVFFIFEKYYIGLLVFAWIGNKSY
ncbi:MAG: hypothetical protein RL607_1326 [Bacteroidota bacterium]|jgi:hypothetical protein